ncbi:MAG: 6-phosphogluconolactonase [Pseudomonadales bacterium]|nr:6-phosphogluconolactonase [Pseudomonadales bacterium]
MLTQRDFASAELLDKALVDAVAAALAADIAQHGHAILVVSGGRTPLGFMQLLAQQALAWQQVTVTLADERWVDADDADSNEKLVRDNLLLHAASVARFVGLKNAAATAAEGEAAASDVLGSLGQFSVVILGMGEDGHTASLFPGAANLARGLDMTSGQACVAMTPPHARRERLSLTLPRLLASRRIFLHLCGSSKRQVLAAALAGDDVLALPVRAVLQQQQVPVTVYSAP